MQCDVLIVGAGPVGLVSASMFERLGVNAIVVERRPGLHTAPQAHVISTRSLEICRAIGLDDGIIRQRGPSPIDLASVRWVDHLLGRDLGVFLFMENPERIMEMMSQTPTPTCQLSQDQFEDVLADHLADGAPVLFEHNWAGFSETADGYVSRIEKADGTMLDIESRFIVAADGAGSPVRAAIGFDMEGPDQIQSYVNVHFHANMREELKGREGALYWIMDPECEGCFIAHNIEGNWIYMKTLDPDLPRVDIDEAHYERLLRMAIGADIDIDIQSMSAWTMTAQVATGYQKDGVFLVGDSAHRFPPTGGLGMNTGFQDAFNLTWKIAMVLNGFDPKLLDTYETERRPSAAANCKQSHENFNKMTTVNDALDYDGDGVLSMSDFDQVLADPERKARVQSEVIYQSEHFSGGGLDLGVCYESSAILSDGLPPVPENPISQYIPSTVPGVRLPHCWLQKGDARVSTLDLLSLGRFMVLSFADAGDALESRVRALSDQGYPIDLASITAEGDIRPADGQVGEIFADEEVLVVRPDGHIGARLSVADAADKLEATLALILGERVAA